jgi:hypothetical protein
MPLLRRIAVTVTEDEEGAYRWRLVELGDESWQVLREQPRGIKTYKAAMAQGLLELQGMVDDLDAGPREAEPEAKAEQTQAGKGGAAFGFGFGLPKVE